MFPIIDVPPGAAELFEQLGTKEKFWYADVQLGHTLFKQGRPNTGENWAEKLACELADALGVPHAFYELARWCEQDGVVSPSFVPSNGRLVHGNEIFSKTKSYVEYADAKPYRSRAHTIRLFAAFFKHLGDGQLVLPPADFAAFTSVTTAGDVVVGYLMLDAWIGNQDRHDQNWGVVIDPADRQHLFLAPSFDHGSSFARNLTDAACEDVLQTKDKLRHISAFVQRARSGLYPHGAAEGSKSMLTIDAFSYMAKMWPDAARAWLGRLEMITSERIADTVALLPDEIATPIRKRFLTEFLILNRQRLLALETG